MKSLISLAWFVAEALAGLLFLSGTACGQVDRAEWTEQVLLANGDLIVVRRAASRDTKGSPVSRRGGIRTAEVTFPDNRTVWKSEGAVRPIAVEVVDGIALLAVDIHSRAACTKYENPIGSVLFFRWKVDRWERISRMEYPKNGRVNLLLSPWGRSSAEDVSGFIKHADKHARPGNSMVDRQLDQRIVDKSSDTCELYKKG